jgi:hypothetical protein
VADLLRGQLIAPEVDPVDGRIDRRDRVAAAGSYDGRVVTWSPGDAGMTAARCEYRRNRLDEL